MLTSLELPNVIVSDFIDTRSWYFERLQPLFGRMRGYLDRLSSTMYQELEQNSKDFDSGFSRSIIPGIVAVSTGILLVFLLLFELHYFHRAFVFPWLMRGRSKMPLSIIGTAVLFNTLNAYMQGGWLFYVSPVDYYSADWLTSLPFLAGTALFLFGMGVNIHSDRIIRNLRKPGDTAHYLPRGGMFRWVTSANYFGELVEWTGFAILTWSVSGAVFALWTFANLAPRAARIYNGYRQEFPEQLDTRTTKRIIPFIF
jgi:3-oxo-5-alpha-steroid 4-dehydrogenase 1